MTDTTNMPNTTELGKRYVVLIDDDVAGRFETLDLAREFAKAESQEHYVFRQRGSLDHEFDYMECDDTVCIGDTVFRIIDDLPYQALRKEVVELVQDLSDRFDHIESRFKDVDPGYYPLNYHDNGVDGNRYLDRIADELRSLVGYWLPSSC